MDPDYGRRAFAEFVGAFALTFIGAGAVMAGAGGLVGVALAQGFVIAVMMSAVAHISGGHFNPAVTLGFLVTRRIDPALAVAYWIFQFLGGIVAALLLWWIFPAQAIDPTKLGAPLLHPSIGSGAGLACEAIAVFFLMWVFFATAADERGTFKSIAGLAVGFTVAFGYLGLGPLTGAPMNPSRAFGVELVGWAGAGVNGVWTDAWIYYLGPFAGAVIAALVYQWLYLGPTRPAVVGTPASGVDEPRPGDTALS
jgi:aquaporin Z